MSASMRSVFSVISFWKLCGGKAETGSVSHVTLAWSFRPSGHPHIELLYLVMNVAL